MRVALALLMIVHGIAHLVGFVVPWRLIELPAQPYRTTILRGAVDFGEAGIRLYAGAWLILAVSFAALAAGLLLRAQWWYRGSLLAGGVSALLCVLSWPDTRFRRTRKCVDRRRHSRSCTVRAGWNRSQVMSRAT